MRKASMAFLICFLLQLPFGFSTSAAETPLQPINFENWMVGFNNSGSNYAEGTAAVITDASVAHTGDRCIYIAYPLGKMSNRYMTLKSNSMTFDSSQKCKFSFWMKASAGSKGVAARIGWNAGRFTILNDTALSEDMDWTYYEFICTANPSGSQTLLFLIENTCADGLWLDDLSVTACDADGNAIGGNLLLNPGFESTVPPSEVQAVEVEYGIGEMQISWTNPEEADYQKAIIYQVADGQEPQLVAEVQNPLNSYTVQNLKDHTPYQYLITTCDTAGDASPGVTVSGTYTIPRPAAPDVSCDDRNDAIIGIDETMEYRIENGEWIAYDAANPPNLSGECTVWVRVAASGLIPAGEETRLVFSAAYPNVIKDDWYNRIVGIDDSMEYQKNGGEWVRYDASNPPDLSGDCVVKIRDIGAGSKMRVMTFTKNITQPTGNSIQAEIQYDNGAIVVNGATPAGEGNRVTLIACKEGSDIREYENIFELRQLVGGPNGSFTARFTMPDQRNNQSTSGKYVLWIDGENADRAMPALPFYHRTAGERQQAAAALVNCADVDDIMQLLALDAQQRPAFVTMGLPIDKYDTLSAAGKRDFAGLLLARLGPAADAELLAQAFTESMVIALLNDAENVDAIETVLADYKEILHLQYDDTLTYETLLANQDVDALNWIFERLLDNERFGSLADIQTAFESAYLLDSLNQAAYSSVETLIAQHVALLGLAGNTRYERYLALPAYSNDSADRANRVSVNKELVSRLHNAPAKDVAAFTAAFESAVKTADGSRNVGGGSGGGGGGGSSGSGYFEIAQPETNNNTPADESVVFSDIANVSWAKESIEALVRKGVLAGYPGNLFMPHANVTREEFVKMLVAGFGLYDGEAECRFADVQQNAWYYRYIASAQACGIVEGMDNNTFGVGSQITREQMAVLAYRTIRYLDIELAADAETVEFDDENEMSDYAKAAISAMQAAGIINGVGDNKYAPKETANRAQAAKVIYTLLKYQAQW